MNSFIFCRCIANKRNLVTASYLSNDLQVRKEKEVAVQYIMYEWCTYIVKNTPMKRNIFSALKRNKNLNNSGTTWEWIKYFLNVVLFILQALHGAAVNAGITVMNECGVDPGNYKKINLFSPSIFPFQIAFSVVTKMVFCLQKLILNPDAFRVLLHNGGFCNGCITQRCLHTKKMCHIMILFHNESNQKILCLSHFLNSIGFVINNKLVSIKSVL